MFLKNKTSKLLLALIINFIVTVPAFADSLYPKGLVVKFFGEGHAGLISPTIKSQIDYSNIDLTGFDCFELPVLDPASGKKLGIGVDCLRGISSAGDVHGDGLQLEAITFFFLKNGSVVNHGCTSVRPFFEGIGDTGVTHMTGSIGSTEFGSAPSSNSPTECSSNQGIINGTGIFKDVKGEARLSGAVNLNNAANGIIKFSCLFVLNFDKKKAQF